MSKSLLFECDPVDQPAATDPVKRETWCPPWAFASIGESSEQSRISRFKASERVCICPHFPLLSG